MRVAAASLHPVALEGEDDPPQPAQAAPAAVQQPRTTLRFDADPTRPATITTEAKGCNDPARRSHLERELDRVQAALAAEQTSFGQQLTWLLLSQGLLFNAFVVLLVFGWSAPLPGRRLVLAGIAALAVATAVLVALALRGTREGLGALTKARQDIERRLENDHARVPLYPARAPLSRGLGHAAARALPGILVAGWLALSLYTLGLPSGAGGIADARAAGSAATPARPARAGQAQAAPPTSPEPHPAKRAPFK